MAKGIFYGCTTRANPRLKGNLDKVLEKMGEEVIPMGLDICCGAPLILAGYMEEAKKQAKKVVETIRAKGIDTLITPCPHCFTIIGKEYSELLDVSIEGISVLHITQFVADVIKNGKLKIKNEVKKKISYHDPCYIGRQGPGIYDEPREILSAIPGIELIEPELTKEESTCCGGGGLLRAYLPRLSVEVSKEKMENQFSPLGVDTVVSACPFCFLNLAEGAEGTGIEVNDILEILVKALE